MIQFTKLVTLEANMAVQGNMTLKVNLMVSTGPQQQHPDLLAQIWMPHSHMGTMTAHLKQLVVDGSSDMDNRPSRSGRTPQQHFLSPPSSESEDNTEPMGSNKRPHCDDKLSVFPSETDVEHLLDMQDPEAKGANGLASKIGQALDDEDYLKSLEADLADDDPGWEKIQQTLDNIASKWWGLPFSSDNLKVLLNKHTKPENCAEITVAKVNPEIWSQMNNFKHKTALRIGNTQEALQKATFAILKSCDMMLSAKISVSKETLSHSIDTKELL